jgi:hypothetical protein
LEPKLISSNATNTFEENSNEERESSSINKKENLNQPSKSCCCSLYKMDHILKNMQKMWSMID